MKTLGAFLTFFGGYDLPVGPCGPYLNPTLFTILFAQSKTILRYAKLLNYFVTFLHPFFIITS